MLDVTLFRNAHIGMKSDSFSQRAMTSFVEFLEKKLGVIVAYDRSRMPFCRDDLSDLFDIAETLRRNSIIATYDPPSQLPDEPHFHQWRAVGAKPRSHITGGMSVESAHAALTSALAEAVERHLWFDATDYFNAPTRTTFTEIMHRGRAINPERFAGYSQAQRDAQTKFSIKADSSFLWILARSWTSDDTVSKRIWCVFPPTRPHTRFAPSSKTPRPLVRVSFSGLKRTEIWGRPPKGRLWKRFACGKMYEISAYVRPLTRVKTRKRLCIRSELCIGPRAGGTSNSRSSPRANESHCRRSRGRTTLWKNTSPASLRGAIPATTNSHRLISVVQSRMSPLGMCTCLSFRSCNQCIKMKNSFT